MESEQSPKGKLAPAPLTLLLGDLAMRLLAYAEHLDFILSVRDEKLAAMFQFFRDSGWWIVAIGSAIWLYYEWRRHKASPNATDSVGALVFSAAFVAFSLGVLVAVSATATIPNIIQDYMGDNSPDGATCGVDVDTSKLVGFRDDFDLVLLCGVSDPKIDAQEDTRIAVSSRFHINGGPMGIKTALGKIPEAWKDRNPPTPPSGQGVAVKFQMWHTVALIPNDVDPATIRRASDIKKMRGRILTDPVGGFGSPMEVTLAPPAPPKIMPVPGSVPKKT